MLSDLTDRTGFDSAIRTVEQAIIYQAADPDSLRSLYRRLYTDVPLIPPLEADEAIPEVPLILLENDLSTLDRALQKGGAENG